MLTYSENIHYYRINIKSFNSVSSSIFNKERLRMPILRISSLDKDICFSFIKARLYYYKLV